jgi:hypothetical protein
MEPKNQNKAEVANRLFPLSPAMLRALLRVAE